jgi:BlaI family penicillinase repressor
MGHLPALSESEWLIMSRLWQKSPLTASEILATELDGKTMMNYTVRALLRRLVSKKAIDYTIDENNKNLFHYFPLINEQDCTRKENKHFLEIYYQNNRSKLFSAFFDDKDLSSEEIENFEKMLNAKKLEIEKNIHLKKNNSNSKKKH